MRYALRLPDAIYRHLKRNRVKQRVAMLHTGRCGSTVLGDILNQHSSIHWAGELFDKYMPELGQQTVRTDASAIIRQAELKSRKPTFGFETKYLPMQHLCRECVDMNVSDYCEMLGKLGFHDIIVLHRKNHLRRAVSVEVGRTRGKWHDRVGPGTATRVRISLDAIQTGCSNGPLLSLFDCIEDTYACLLKRLTGWNVLQLSYEDDILADPLQAYEKTCTFLGVVSESPCVALKRSNPFRLEEVVENYEEVKDALQGTGFEWMLNDHS